MTRFQEVLTQMRGALLSANYKSHDRFPSEVQLQKKYGVSGDTVRKVLRNLMDEGLIYRERWRGTFVAPRGKTKKILVVTHFNSNSSDLGHGITYGYAGFEHGLRSQNSQPGSVYDLVSVCKDEFLSYSHDLQHIHKHLAGVIFFRDVVPLLQSRHLLLAGKVPFMFYGSDRHRPRLTGDNTWLYSEEEIVKAGLEFLHKKGHRKIVFVSDITDAEARHRHAETWMRKAGIWSDTLAPLQLSSGMLTCSPRELTKTYTALFCEKDQIACSVLNSLIRGGISIPRDLAVLGCNNYPICEESIVPLSSVNIPIVNDGKGCMKTLMELAEGKRKGIDERSTISVIEREST